MEKAKVYFTDLHTSTRLPLVEKMKAVAKAAGIEKIDFKDKFVAIKMHFGEPGNLAFLRPNYAAGMADLATPSTQEAAPTPWTISRAPAATVSTASAPDAT